MEFDLADSASVDSMLEPGLKGLKHRRPAFICLLNNAGTADPLGPLGRLSASEITSGLAVNLASAVALANLFCGVFTDEDAPRRVVNISSGAAERAIPGESVYSVAKAGIEMLTLALAAEHEAPNFRAVSVRPGVIDTDMQAFLRAQSPGRAANRRLVQELPQ